MAAAVPALVPAFANMQLSNAPFGTMIFPPTEPQEHPRDATIVQMLYRPECIAELANARLIAEYARYQPNREPNPNTSTQIAKLFNSVTHAQQVAAMESIRDEVVKTGDLVLEGQLNCDRMAERLFPIIGALQGVIHALVVRFDNEEQSLQEEHACCQAARSAMQLLELLPPNAPIEHLTINRSLIVVHGIVRNNDPDMLACAHNVTSTFTTWLRNTTALSTLTIDCDHSESIPFITIPRHVRHITLAHCTAENAEIQLWHVQHAPHAEVTRTRDLIQEATHVMSQIFQSTMQR